MTAFALDCRNPKNISKVSPYIESSFLAVTTLFTFLLTSLIPISVSADTTLSIVRGSGEFQTH